jgi:hypothetical protein
VALALIAPNRLLVDASAAARFVTLADPPPASPFPRAAASAPLI